MRDPSMRVLAINCGSSTLKFQLFELERDSKSYGQERRLAKGLVEEIGTRGILSFTIENGESLRKSLAVADHGQAIRHVLAWLESSGLFEHDRSWAVGHRVVHGGSHFTEAAVIKFSFALKGTFSQLITKKNHAPVPTNSIFGSRIASR